MSVVQTSIAPAASLVVQSNQSASAARTDSNQSGNNAVQQSVVSGQAALVSLSADSKTRAASYGESRSVDASFDKQQVEEKKKKEKDSPAGGDDKSSPNSIDVAA